MALNLHFTHPLRSFDASVELTVEDGTTTALVGPSGAGKTTVLRVVPGLLRPRDGLVSLGRPRLARHRAWRRRPAGTAARRLPLSGVRALPAPRRARERTLRRAFGSPVAELLERFQISHLAERGWASCPAASASASRSPARSRSNPACSCSTSRCRRSMPIRRRPCGSSCTNCSATSPCRRFSSHTTSRTPPLSPTGSASSSTAGFSRSAHRPSWSQPSRPVRRELHRRHAPAGDSGARENGLTEVVLDAGGTAWSTDAGSRPCRRGRVPVGGVPLPRAVPDSAVNHIRATVGSVVPLGNRARVRVGPIVAEVTSASVERLGLREGDAVVASFKATATRLLPL